MSADTQLNRWMPSNLDELLEAVQEMRTDALAAGYDTSTVNVDVRFLAMIEKTLTDGSKVLDILVTENR